MWAFILVRLLIAWGVNVLALIVVDWMFDSVYIGRWGSLLIGAFVLAVGNAFIKPILAILTLPLIIFTLGLAYFAINVAMLALAEWIAPDFSIDGFWTYVWATIVVWFVNFVVGRLLDHIEGEQRRRPSTVASDGELAYSSSSTSGAPAATWSPSATCTRADGRVVGRDDRRLHLHRLEHEERRAGGDPRPLFDEDADHGAGHLRREQALAGSGSALVRRLLDVWHGRRGRRREVRAPGAAPRVGSRSGRSEREWGMLDEEGSRRAALEHDGMRDEPA